MININYNEFWNNLLDWLKTFWNSNKKNILIFTFLVGFIYFVFSGYFSTCHKDNHESLNKQPVNANYRSDMNFLECIAEQHSCIYKNLENFIDHLKIKEACGDENYCSNPKSYNR